MRLTVIVSYYKAIENLKIILKALQLQTCDDFEVIISEDDYNLATIQFITENQNSYKFALRHTYQAEDNGFRKNIMLNKSLRACQTELVAFIDGDCIPHKHFVNEYIKNIKKGYVLTGRAVMLGEKISAKIKENLDFENLNLISLLRSDSTKIKDSIYFPFFPLAFKTNKRLVGRNWGINKSLLFEINGFDEDYIQAGVGEDVDIEWRLLANGIKRMSMKNKAIVYHLYHPRIYSTDGIYENYAMMKLKKDSNLIQCINGLEINKTDAVLG